MLPTGLDEDLLGPALLDPVIPVLPVVGITGSGDRGTVEVSLARRSGVACTNEVNRPGADHDVVPDPAPQRGDRPLGIGAGVAGEVDDGVEVATRQNSGEVLGCPIGPKSLDAVPKRVEGRSPVQERDPMSPGDQSPGQLVADETDSHR